MNQLLLIQSGCQQWIRQPVAIGPCQQFAVCSSLAIYVHRSDDYRLLRILAQHNQHLNAICWSPVDSSLLACATSEQVIKIYHVESEGVVYSAQAPMSDAIKKLCWSTHDESVLLASAGNVIGSWAYKAGNWRVLHSFKAAVTCMQQSASETRLLAVGCADGSLHLYDLLQQKVVSTVRLEGGKVPCDVLFDPLSKQYLLLLCGNGSTMLYGISEDDHGLNQVFALAKQPAAERSAAFLPTQPGNFVSINNKTGVLQLWNVSQQQPLKNLKTGKGPAQSVQFFPGSNKALLSFQDGTVMVFDVRAGEVLWSTQPGHTETIFDCCLHPTNPQLLATCSYDSTMRVWDISSGNCEKTLDLASGLAEQKQPLALYSVTWSTDGSQLAASGANGAVYLYDYAKGTAVKKWQLHTKMSLKVAWHPADPTLLVSSSIDGSVVAFKTDGTKVKVLRHAGSSSGLAWHHTASHQLATTSEAGPVYVWDLNKPGDSCLLQTLNGHSKRSFSVAWSPLLPELLLSGSDDATARVWDVSTGTCIALLLGHALEVRALCWHPEVPWLVFTGSWDSTIRAWDIRSRTCIYVNSHHHSDVYGLSIHKACPWVMVSASRDTTLRLWDIKGLAAALLPRCFLDTALPRGQAEEYMTHSLPLLCGPSSQQLADWCAHHMKCNAGSASLTGSTSSIPVASLSAAASVELFQKLSACFSAPGPAHTLWQLAATVAVHLATTNSMPRSPHPVPAEAATLQRAGSVNLVRSSSNASGGGAVKPLPGSMSCGFQHVTAAKAALVSAANQLELSVCSRGAGKVAMGAARKEEVMVEAAILHLQAGQAEHCCDILAEAGEWDKALMIAPVVSQEYWAKMLKKRADLALQAGTNVLELLPMMLAAGQTTPLTEQLLAQKQYALAASVAAVQACGGYQHFSSASTPEASALTVAAAPASPNGPASPSRASPLSHTAAGALSPLSNPPQLPLASQAPQLMLPHEASTLSTRRNSLPPLRTGTTSMSGANASSSNSSGAAATPAGFNSASGGAAKATAALAAASLDLDRNGSSGRPASPGSILGLASTGPESDRTAAGVQNVGGEVSGMLEGPLQISSSFARMRSCSSALGPSAGSTVVDVAAMGQLAAVRQVQAMAHRQKAQPLLAACAALTVNDIRGAVTALHLGHEPEQAAMLAIALGQLGALGSSLLDRVFAALASRCEAAGDWEAAAMATRLLSNEVQHHLQLLVVRSERSSKQHRPSSAAAATPTASGIPTCLPQQAAPSLRWHLGLRDVAYYSAAAATASTPLDSVRFLLLAGDHVHAATLAGTHLQHLAGRFQQAVLQPAVAATCSNSSPAGSPSAQRQRHHHKQQQIARLDHLPEVQQLYMWQACLDSLDPPELVPICWQELFSYNLLAGALKSYSYGYTKVGSFLMSSLRRWVERHQVKFPMCRAALLVLEAEVLQHSSPESACSLLIAAADAPDTPADIVAVAHDRLQGFPKPAIAAGSAGSEAVHVVPTGSCWPCRSAPGSSRSAVSGKLVQGPWMFLDDGCSVVTYGEGVMLAQVMRCGPCGTGRALQLL